MTVWLALALCWVGALGAVACLLCLAAGLTDDLDPDPTDQEDDPWTP